MRHRRAGRKFGRGSSNRLAMFRNQVTSLLEHERIETTIPRAKEVRGIAERLITLGKRGGLHAVRLVERVVRKKSVITKLFGELAPRFQARPGGYTRIVRTRRRLGDGAPMGFLELLPPPGGRPARGAPRPEAEAKPEATEKPAEKPAKKPARKAGGEIKRRAREQTAPAAEKKKAGGEKGSRAEKKSGTAEKKGATRTRAKTEGRGKTKKGDE